MLGEVRNTCGLPVAAPTATVRTSPKSPPGSRRAEKIALSAPNEPGQTIIAVPFGDAAIEDWNAPPPGPDRSFGELNAPRPCRALDCTTQLEPLLADQVPTTSPLSSKTTLGISA